MHPLLYEVNTRQWLAELSRVHGRALDLAHVPEQELERLERLGVTHLWLMGVWPTGPIARGEALASADLRRAYDEALPGWQEADVLGSPYAIEAYDVAAALGGDAALAVLRARLAERNIRVILDFVPNHVGRDHAWVRERPELFVQALTHTHDTFLVPHRGATRLLAHGRDPYFAGWTDTAQLDVRRTDTRAAMIEALRSIAERCDGVRCDMAMLVLEDVFARTWGAAPPPPQEVRATGELWADAIGAVRREHPEFVFLAEAYWDLEHELCALGFDWAYDKKLYDHLVHDRVDAVSAHVLGLGDQNARRAHFLENHDEPRAATVLPADRHKAAALLTLGLPGLRFLHDGQLEGRRVAARVQLARVVQETPDAELSRFYSELLADLAESPVGRGEAHVLAPRAAWEGNGSHQGFVLVQWRATDRADRFDLVVVNLASHRAQCYAPLSAFVAGGTWALADRLGQERYTREGDDLASRGLFLDVDARAAQLFAFRRE
jgi:glycosidase